jgi:trimethyllysine dioxygenase
MVVRNVVFASSQGDHPFAHDTEWLRGLSFQPVARHRILWGSSIASSTELPRVEYDQVMQDDRGVYEWLTRIVRHLLSQSIDGLITIASQDRFGFSFVEGVPATPEATEELTRRIAFIKETQCRSDPAACDVDC